MGTKEEKAKLRESLKLNGWKQGVALPHDLKKKLFGPEAGKDSFAVVVSQDCDVISPNEPCAEAILLHGLDYNGKREARGENPRELHLKCEYCSESIWVSAKPWERKIFDRSLLEKIKPEPEFTIRNIEMLREWLANRYSRWGRPDDFDRMFGDAGGSDRLKRALKRNENHRRIGGLFIRIDPECDLEEGEDYEVTVAIVLSPGKEDDFKAHAAANAVKEDLEDTFAKCEQISATCEVYAANEFTYEDFTYMRKWDYDYFSNEQ